MPDGLPTVVVLPDVHVGTKCTPDDFAAMISWIVNNQAAQNIQLVVSVGDLTGTGFTHTNMATALAPIKTANIPISLCVGNHDYDAATGRACTAWNANGALGADFYAGDSGFGSTFETDAGEGAGVDPGGTINHYRLLTIDGVDYLLLFLEFGPRDKVMDWANTLVTSTYADRKVIVFTHSYLETDGTLTAPGDDYNPKNTEGFSVEPGDEYTNDGADMWARWLLNWPNLVTVYCGHDINSPPQNHRRSVPAGGGAVYQIFANYQNWGYDTAGSTMVLGESNEKAALLRLVRIWTSKRLAFEDNYLPISNVTLNASISQHAWNV